MENKNHPIHPIADLNEYPSTLIGLTKREYFAVMIMNGICSSGLTNDGEATIKNSIKLADELLKQLSNDESK